MSTPVEPRRLEDLEEDALVQADLIAHEAFGADESRWTEEQVDGYLASLHTVRSGFAESVAAGLTESYSAFEARMNAKEATS